MARTKRNRKRMNKRRRKAVIRRNPSLDFHEFKLTLFTEVLVDAQGLVSAWINCHNPSSYYNESGVTYSLNNITGLLDLFDTYRVKALGFKFNPYFNQYGQPLGGADKESGMNVAPTINVCYDPDQVGKLTGPNPIIARPRARSFSPMKPFRYSVRPQNVNQGATGGQPYVGSLTNGWLNLQNPTANVTGTVTVAGNVPYQLEGINLATGTAVGSLSHWIIIQCKNRKGSS